MVRRLLLLVGAAALLAAPGAHGQPEPTGTTGAGTGADQTVDPPRSTVTLQPRSAPPPPTVVVAPAPRADLPPEASPGQCFARVALPRRTETYQEQVQVRPERRETRVVPAGYADVEERVLVTPERVIRTNVPATYRTVTETMVVRPARTRVETIAPEYRQVAEQVLASPPRREWVREPSFSGQEVWRLVETPPLYRTVMRNVLVSPARRAEFTDPAVTREVSRRVVDQPARVDERVVPAVYRTEKRRKLVTPERRETVVIAAEWRMVEKTRPVGSQVLDWREAPCAKAVTPDLIRRVQAALTAQGHPLGAPDGVWGARTRQALDDFQRAQGLPHGALTLETLRALNVGA